MDLNSLFLNRWTPHSSGPAAKRSEAVLNIQRGYLRDHMPEAGSPPKMLAEGLTLNRQINNGPLCSIIC
ncbi:hypothetical protein EYF80_048249 [Liparis tanakae]|uniref:Uncharacterized protein n=1 Tax=Liparis tanakae TaxID=230148 RepID=A0A4Z2FKP8_9TELE|nr:hypothetical protein EYF80_048249 [Liparis tanakae]